MKTSGKLAGNALLVGILFALLFLPFGAVGLSGVKQDEVLSETTEYQPVPLELKRDNYETDEDAYLPSDYYDSVETTASTASTSDLLQQ